MRLKIISLNLLIGLTLPLTNGAALTNADQSLSKNFSEFFDNCKKTQGGIAESNLRSYLRRHRTLIKREKAIQALLDLFTAHICAPAPTGLDYTSEGVRTNLGLAEMVQPIATPTSESRAQKKGSQHEALDTARDCLRRLKDFSDINTAYLAQLKKIFTDELEILKYYRDERVISELMLESPFPQDSTTPEKPALPPIKSLVDEFLKLESTIKEGDDLHIGEASRLLRDNRSKLQTLLERAKALSVSEENRPKLGLIIDALIKATHVIDDFFKNQPIPSAQDRSQ
jgi:hypothetical protein